MTTEKHHRDRTVRQQRGQADKPTGLVRQHERRHRLARTRRVLAATVFVDALGQPIDRLAIGRKYLAPRCGISFKLLTERTFHVATALEGLPEAFGIGGGKPRHGFVPPSTTPFFLTGGPPPQGDTPPPAPPSADT